MPPVRRTWPFLVSPRKLWFVQCRALSAFGGACGGPKNLHMSMWTKATRVCAFMADGTCSTSSFEHSSVACFTIALHAFSRLTPAESTSSWEAFPFSMSGPATPRSALCGDARAPREARIPTAACITIRQERETAMKKGVRDVPDSQRRENSNSVCRTQSKG